MQQVSHLRYRFFTAALTWAVALTFCCQAAVASAAAEEQAFALQFVAEHCAACHGAERPKADLSLEALREVTAANAEVWERCLAQIAMGEMPPKRRQPQPRGEDRERMIAWLMKSLGDVGRSPQLPGGPLPTAGNLVSHEQLFSGLHRGPAWSPPRYWRRNQHQYDALMEELWVIPKLRYEKAPTRDDPRWAAFSYAQPFPALGAEGFSDYAGSVHADESTLRSLMNAGWQIAVRLTSDDVAYAPEHQPPIAVGIPFIRRGSEWERFKVDPPARPEPFAPFLAADAAAPTAEQRRAAIACVFEIFLDRTPSAQEMQRYDGLLLRGIERNGPLTALRSVITAVLVSPEFVFRMELGMGEVDEYGRHMLSPNELVYAIAYALTDNGPDDALWEAARTGKLRTKADVEREVRRILADDSIEKHPRLRFFQEFFGYIHAGEVFKERDGWEHEVRYLIRDADLFVEHILAEDRDVFARLLTEDRYFVAYPVIEDPALFEAIIKHTQEFTEQGVARSKELGREIKPDGRGLYHRHWAYVQGYTLIPKTVHNRPERWETTYIEVYGFDGRTFSWPREQPIKLPGRRAGILTHPAWLVAHSTNFDNDVVGRGHWIREHLLAGRIPDVPLDVDATVPDEPESTLRHRMRVTQAERCIRCHTRMDPLGFPFEIYDHFGRFREMEMVGERDNIPKPIDPSGAINESGEPALDGPVVDAIDLVHKLAKSERVRQSFVRHAFRFWMGRNETLDDSPTLIAADKAYVESGGSFNEVIVSLLTSDSFLYRRSPLDATRQED